MASQEIDLFLKVQTDSNEVFVNKSLISDNQFCQITKSTVRVVVPKLRIKQLFSSKHSLRRRSKANVCDNSRAVLNYKNQSNDSNVTNNCLKSDSETTTDRPKRKLRSKADFLSNDKKAKNDFKSVGGTALNVVKSDDDQKKKKNKENKNNCNLELSRVIGLPNMGNTCYINSIIQVLRMTPGFRQFVCLLNKTIANNKSGVKLKTSNNKLITSLHNVFVHFGDNEKRVNNSGTYVTNESKISDLIECKDIKNRFEFGQQQDCHEFLNWLISELNSFAETLFPNKDIPKNFVKSVYNTRQKSDSKQSMTYQSFHGIMLRNITCSECHKRSYHRDSFAEILIPLCVNEEVSESQTFTEIIHKMDYLKDDNKFDCHNCSKKTNAFVLNSIERPPKVLIIFMKKPFEYNVINTRNVKPMQKLFKVPLSLEYSSEKSIRYSLYAFVMHNGSDLDNGHYYAVIDSGAPNCKSNHRSVCSCDINVLAKNGWIKVNDHKVTKLNTSYISRLLDNDSIDSTPYLAFYQRID